MEGRGAGPGQGPSTRKTSVQRWACRGDNRTEATLTRIGPRQSQLGCKMQQGGGERQAGCPDT